MNLMEQVERRGLYTTKYPSKDVVLAILAALESEGFAIVPTDLKYELHEWECYDTSDSYWSKVLDQERVTSWEC